MARGRKVTVEHMLTTAAITSGGLAVGLGAIDVPVLASILLGMMAATATCLLGVRHSLARFDWFDCGYRAGWSDAAHEFCPFPAERTAAGRVVPLRQRSLVGVTRDG